MSALSALLQWGEGEGDARGSGKGKHCSPFVMLSQKLFILNKLECNDLGFI